MFIPMDKARFSSWLLAQMNEKNLSQAQLAKQSGLSRQAISNFINQISVPNPESCVALAKGLGVPDDFVLEAAGHRPPQPNRNPALDEANYKLAQLPEWQQKLVISFIDTLLREGQDSVSPNLSPDTKT